MASRVHAGQYFVILSAVASRRVRHLRCSHSEADIGVPSFVRTRFGERLNQKKRLAMEDQAGFEPAVSLRCRLKRPARSAATVTGPMIVFLEDASGYDPQANGLKVRSLSI